MGETSNMSDYASHQSSDASPVSGSLLE